MVTGAIRAAQRHVEDLACLLWTSGVGRDGKGLVQGVVQGVVQLARSVVLAHPTHRTVVIVGEMVEELEYKHTHLCDHNMV